VVQSRIGVTGLMLATLACGCGRVGYETEALAAGAEDGGAMDAATADAGLQGAGAYCGNRLVEAAEVCDDGNRTGGDGCSADCLRNELCGDGVVAAAEACDDGNSVNGDGCDNHCTLSCTEDAQCDDGEPCNGDEVCPGTNACEAGTPLSEATACEADGACRGGTCAPAGCGDMVVAAGEDCDDGNTVPDDGCENDCTFSCAVAADCDDGDACNGVEGCVEAAHLCTAGVGSDDGTLCDRDSMPATRDVCLGGACAASRCGDAFVDSARGEDCDDGNGVNGDGCDNDCTFSCEDHAECQDGLVCTGVETCDATHQCVPGMAPPDGTSCEGGGTCRSGICLVLGTDGGIVVGGRTMCGTRRCEVCCCASTSLCASGGGACPDIVCNPKS
jgi:cysteine-rich repeat protein